MSQLIEVIGTLKVLVPHQKQNYKLPGMTAAESNIKVRSYIFDVGANKTQRN